MKKGYGFTIVELLIVIVVIGVLASITAVAYNGVTTRAKDMAKLAEIEQFIKHIVLYKAANGNYPLPVPATETAIYSAHSANSPVDSVFFVTNKKAMLAKETQKLSAFQSEYGFNIPSGTVYYYDSYGGGKTYAFVMASFLDDKNIPEHNRSYRLQSGATNTMFPRLIAYTYGPSAACDNVPLLGATVPQSTGAVGNYDAPLLIDDSLYMNNRMIYDNVAGCNTVGYIRDTYSGGVGYTRKSGTGLFPLKSYSL